MSGKWSDATEHAMSGGREEKKPKKEIHHVEVRKSDTKGDHIITHHHTHPEHHPAETHTTRGDDEMTAHMLQNMGTSPQSGDADPNAAPDPNAAAAPDPTAAAAGAAPPPAAGAGV